MSHQGDQQDKAKAFRALHVPGDPLILLNVWDAGSAAAVAKAGRPSRPAVGRSGVVDISLIARLAAGSPLPVNIMRMGTEPSIASLADAGSARVSHGPAPYLQAMAALEQMARDVR
ncbi:MAG TPA: isocitrate lyase/phosphoenolpyruvate mutase family protein [Thermoanaerobaculia bacterium]|jgi:2-methylisocitrate lyase-like PEP mutase family enzyme